MNNKKTKLPERPTMESVSKQLEKLKPEGFSVAALDGLYEHELTEWLKLKRKRDE